MDNPSPAPVTPLDQNKLMSVLAYVGPLIIVSYLVAKDNAAVKFHIKQGGVLFVIEIAVWVLSIMLPYLYFVWQIVNLATLIFAILGVVNVAQGKEKELPFIGSFGKYIPV